MAALARTPPAAAEPIPHLRQDVELQLQDSGLGGYPNLVVCDPVRGNYYKLEWPQSGLLYLWREAGDVVKLRSLYEQYYGSKIPGGAFEALLEFLFVNQLTRADSKGSWGFYQDSKVKSKQSFFKTIMHGYLFFRLPLVHPNQALNAMLPYLRFAFYKPFWLVIFAMLVCGIYLSARQWTEILDTIYRMANLHGIFVYAVAVFALKAFHEFGHALTTVRYGCRVPTMGAAFMLGTPVLYTDTTDSWRLDRREQRLAIVFAGVAAELIIAAVAILLWPFLENGFTRDVLFALATTSIILSLTVNLNPFMRYDGYFALSDCLQMPNLQQRAFALTTWRMREILFAMGAPPPEYFSARRAKFLMVYSVCTWIYRLGLYLGIAALVYTMFGKAIGIILGLFELVIFIAVPLYRECCKWWELRGDIMRSSRKFVTGSLAAALLLAVFYPSINTISTPAVLVAANESEIFLPAAAQITNVNVAEGQMVTAGDPLFTATNESLESQLNLAKMQRDSVMQRANQVVASAQESDMRMVIEKDLEQAISHVAALTRQIAQLNVIAPFSGMIVDLDPEISTGVWFDTKKPLATLIATDGVLAKAMLRDEDLTRVDGSHLAKFIPDDANLKTRTFTSAEIAPASNNKLAEPILAQIYGGQVLTTEEKGETKTTDGWFQIDLKGDGTAPAQITRGVIILHVNPTSPFQRFYAQVMRVMVREQGF